MTQELSLTYAFNIYSEHTPGKWKTLGNWFSFWSLLRTQIIAEQFSAVVTALQCLYSYRIELCSQLRTIFWNSCISDIYHVFKPLRLPIQNRLITTQQQFILCFFSLSLSIRFILLPFWIVFCFKQDYMLHPNTSLHLWA